jgi:hypothetical protein
MEWELWGFFGVEGLDMRFCWGFWGKIFASSIAGAIEDAKT